MKIEVGIIINYIKIMNSENTEENICGRVRKKDIIDDNNDNNDDNGYIYNKKKKIYDDNNSNNTLEQFTSTEEFDRRSSHLHNTSLQQNKRSGLYGSYGKSLDSKEISEYIGNNSNNSLEQFTSTEEFDRSRSSSPANLYSPSHLHNTSLQQNKRSGLYGSYGKSLDSKDISAYIGNDMINNNDYIHEHNIERKISTSKFNFNSYIHSDSNNNDTDDEGGWGFYLSCS